MMKKSIDLAREEGITNPRLIDWNILATPWEWNEEKQRYFSTEYHFNDFKWEKQVVVKKEIDVSEN
jgi:hypothetical protein